ncbi:ABC transporter, transmembrane region [Calothrix sp. NIES-4101]|nr:ABC transporter, transmembrane region [Calothrix sp. NIES-4101]
MSQITTKILFQFIKPFWNIAAKAVFLALIVSILEIITVILVMPLIQSLASSNATNTSQTQKGLEGVMSLFSHLPQNWQIWAITISFLVLTILKNLSRYFSYLNIRQFQLSVGLHLRQLCTQRFLDLELSFYNQTNLGEILSYVNEQAQRSEVLSSYIIEIISEVLFISGLTVLLISLSPIMTVVTILSLVTLVPVLKIVMNSVQKYGRNSAKSIENFSIFITELVSGIRVVKSFNAEYREINRVNQLLKERHQQEMKAYKYDSIVVPITETIGIIVLLIIIGVGTSVEVTSRNSTLPFLLTYTLALLRILPRINHLNGMRSHISLLSGSVEAIYDFLNRTADLSLPDGKKIYKGLQSSLSLENVTFTFPSNSSPTLNGMSLQIEKGKTTALVGTSGSGKSTLVDLVMRFYDPDYGCIKIDGIDLREIQRHSWRNGIAMVSQDTFLFHATVLENIAYGYPGATELEIINAAKKAYAYEFIQELPQGFATIVGNRGARLSGGQRQRIAIARAILRDPEILILDEATSALDSTSEKIVQKAIEEVSRDRTVIVIAHRLSTIEKADKIAVISQGRVIEEGNHRELLEIKGKYWSLYQSQVSNTEIQLR